MPYSSDSNGVSGSPQPIPANYQTVETNAKQKESLPKLVELSKEILQNVDTVPSSSNSAQLKEDHKIIAKNSETTSESERQTHEVGTNTLLYDKQDSAIDGTIATDVNDIESEADSEEYAELAILAKMKALQKVAEEKLAEAKRKSEQSTTVTTEARNEATEARTEATEARTEATESKQELKATAQAEKNKKIRAIQEEKASATKILKYIHCIDSGGRLRLLLDEKNTESFTSIGNNLDRICKYKDGKLIMFTQAGKEWLKREGIHLKDSRGDPINIPYDEIGVMNEEDVAKIKKAIDYHIHQLTLAAANPSVNEPEEEKKETEFTPAQHKNDAGTTLVEQLLRERKKAQENQKIRPARYTRSPELESMSPVEFLRNLEKSSEKHHAVELKKLIRFLEHEYIRSEANKYADNLKLMEKKDVKLAESTSKRLEQEAIKRLEKQKSTFDQIVAENIEAEEQRLLNNFKTDSSVKFKIVYEKMLRWVSFAKDQYAKNNNENLSILERETYLKLYYEQICLVLAEMINSTSTSTNIPRSGLF